jgi:hypothetical protein
VTRACVSGCILKYSSACSPYRVPNASLCSPSLQGYNCLTMTSYYSQFSHLDSAFLLIIAWIRKNLFVAIETQVMLATVLNCRRHKPEAAGICFRHPQLLNRSTWQARSSRKPCAKLWFIASICWQLESPFYRDTKISQSSRDFLVFLSCRFRGDPKRNWSHSVMAAVQINILHLTQEDIKYVGLHFKRDLLDFNTFSQNRNN